MFVFGFLFRRYTVLIAISGNSGHSQKMKQCRVARLAYITYAWLTSFLCCSAWTFPLFHAPASTQALTFLHSSTDFICDNIKANDIYFLISYSASKCLCVCVSGISIDATECTLSGCVLLSRSSLLFQNHRNWLAQCTHTLCETRTLARAKYRKSNYYCSHSLRVLFDGFIHMVRWSVWHETNMSFNSISNPKHNFSNFIPHTHTHQQTQTRIIYSECSVWTFHVLVPSSVIEFICL